MRNDMRFAQVKKAKLKFLVIFGKCNKIRHENNFDWVSTRQKNFTRFCQRYLQNFPHSHHQSMSQLSLIIILGRHRKLVCSGLSHFVPFERVPAWKGDKVCTAEKLLRDQRSRHAVRHSRQKKSLLDSRQRRNWNSSVRCSRPRGKLFAFNLVGFQDIWINIAK